MTAIAGRVLQTDGSPLRHVQLKFGRTQTETDAEGRFLLRDVAMADSVLLIDGRAAFSAGDAVPVDHGTYEARVRAEVGRTTALPWVSWLPRIDHAHQTDLVMPTPAAVTVTTPDIPGLELRIPKGAVLTDIEGRVVEHVSLTPIPINRTPFPLPRNVEVPIYFTAQPGGAVITSADGKWLGAQLLYPNYTHQLPKARTTFWRYEPDRNGWEPYGTGTVQADGNQVVPDEGTRIYALSGAMQNAGFPPPPALAALAAALAKGLAAALGLALAAAALAAALGPALAGLAIAAAALAAMMGSPSGADPVDYSSGLFIDSYIDLAVQDTIPVTLTRTYRPGDYNRYSFGVGASSTYDTYLWPIQEYQKVDLVLPGGSTVYYTRIISPANPTDNGYVDAHYVTTTPGLFYQSRIDWNGNGWNLTRKDGAVLVFGENAPLQSISDRYGNTVTLTRSNGTSGNITQVTSPSGRWIRFTYNSNNCITQATDNVGRTVTYAYDSSSRLTGVTDPKGRTTTYAWDSSNRVQSITDPRGAAVVTNTYDSNDRITQQTLADGSTFKLAYTLGSSANVVETDVTDPRGFLRKVTFNSAGWVMTDKSAVGTPQEADFSYTRDPTTNYTTSISDPLGRTLATSFDTNGNLTSITQLAGTSSAATTNFTYSPAFNQLTSMTDPLGHTTTYQRGVFDELTAVVDPLGNTTHYNYNSAGQVVTATDPLNNVTTYAYDHGDLASVQVPLLRTTKFYTDPIGRRLSAADPLGNVSQWAYDPYDGISQATDANGNTTSLTYAPIGRVATVTDPRGGVISYTYDSRWRALTRTDAAGAVASITGRDGNSNILTEVDRKGQSATYAYDPMNRQVSATYAGGATLSWTYDLAGRLTQAQDSVGGTVTRSYDGFDHLLSETTPQGTVSYTYDAAGRRTTMIASGQPQVTYSYDNANRLTGITQSGSTVTFGYDAASRRVSAALPGGVSAAYAYDNASQLLSITYTSGTSTLGTLTYGYDLAGHVVARGGSLFQSVLPASVSSATYNIANRMTQRVAAGVTITPAWDANGSLTSDGLRSYSWDSRNRLTTITGLATFAYDAFGRRSSATIGGIATAYLYDGWDVVQEQQGGTASANLLSGLGIDEPLSRAGATYLTDALGSTVALVNGGVVKTSYGYDPYGSTNVSGTASTNAHQFAGRENDGTGLYAYRNRYYNPAWARFVSEDPIGLAGGINLYAYANNNPIQLRDPFGFNPAAGDKSGGQAENGGSGTAAGGGGNNGEPGVTDHGQQRQDQARSDPNRDVGDPNRVQNQGRKLIDSETGNTIYVDGNKVVVVDPSGNRVSQFKNSRANTQQRIQSGKWIPN